MTSTVPRMTNSDFPWEPPLAGTETEQLLGALDRLRTTFRWKAGHLDAAGLQTRIGASDLTLGKLLKHLAFVEDYTFTIKLRGGSRPAHPGRPSTGTPTPTGPSARPPTTAPRSSTPCGTAPSIGPAPGSTRPWPTAGSTSWSTPATTTAGTPACAGWSSTWSRSTAGTPDTPTCSARPSTVVVGEDPPAGWQP